MEETTYTDTFEDSGGTFISTGEGDNGSDDADFDQPVQREEEEEQPPSAEADEEVDVEKVEEESEPSAEEMSDEETKNAEESFRPTRKPMEHNPDDPYEQQEAELMKSAAQSKVMMQQNGAPSD